MTRKFYFIFVGCRPYDSTPRTWEAADRMRDRILAYYPRANVRLESETVSVH